MSTFGAQREANDGDVRQIYTGVENFRVVAVNPNHEQLKKLYGENAKEEEYLGKTEVNGTEVSNLRLTFHIDNDPEEGEPKISTRINYWVSKTPLISTTKGTKQYINIYGKTIWLSDEDAAKNLPVYENVGANGTYKFDASGKRPAYRGEADFIEFLRAILNLPSPEKAEDPMAAASQFSDTDWNTMFSGNFAALQTMMSTCNNKVGLLLGAKQVEDKVYQDVFNRKVLRQYEKNKGDFTYLLRDVDRAKEAGGFPQTDFGPRDCKLRVYDPSAVPTQANAFENSQPASTGSFFNPETAKAFASKE